MNQRQRTALVGGFLLILFGACLLAVRLAPGWQEILPLAFRWPMILLGVGLLLFVLGLLTGEAGMAVPACIVSGIGLVLYYQVATGDWGSWLYLWPAIPFSAGAGTVLAGILGMNPATSIRNGLWTMLVSLVLFLVFSSLFGGPVPASPYWPALLIVLGLAEMVRNVFLPRRTA